jgi:hypothetical protein
MSSAKSDNRLGDRGGNGSKSDLVAEDNVKRTMENGKGACFGEKHAP